jgi:hypothetical protein
VIFSRMPAAVWLFAFKHKDRHQRWYRGWRWLQSSPSSGQASKALLSAGCCERVIGPGKNEGWICLIARWTTEGESKLST